MIVVAWMFVAIMIAVVGISTVPLPIMFVIFIAPIAIGVPALIVFIPPFMIRSPTLLAGFRQVVPVARVQAQAAPEPVAETSVENAPKTAA